MTLTEILICVGAWTATVACILFAFRSVAERNETKFDSEQNKQ
jgi:hypothetical protein